jgi:hypothetical protein
MPNPLCLAFTRLEGKICTREHTKEEWNRLQDKEDPLSIALEEVMEERRIERERLIALDPKKAFLCG